MSGTKTEPSAELEAVQARVDQWRRTRPKRGAMPEELWAEAVALARRLGAYPVAQGLRLNYGRLKRRLVALEVPQLGTNGPADPAPLRFLELPTAAPVGNARCPVPVAEVELARADGARVTIRLAGEPALDLAHLSEAFFGDGR
ncbi:MAG: hypothetical protein ACI8PZ_005292 [Myxococcota bacterium]